MKTKKTSNEKEESQNANSFPHCGDFQKMAEKMKTFCQGEGDTFDCCSFMRKMMGQDKEAEAKETKETHKPPKGGRNG